MIYKHYERKEHAVYFLIIAVAFAFLIVKTYSATTIGANVQSDGNFLLNNPASSIIFANGWKMYQTAAPSSQIVVTDSALQPVLIFDENR